MKVFLPFNSFSLKPTEYATASVTNPGLTLSDIRCCRLKARGPDAGTKKQVKGGLRKCQERLSGRERILPEARLVEIDNANTGGSMGNRGCT